MSVNLKPISTVIGSILILCACTNKNPTDKDLESAIHTLWNNYSWEFSENFKVESFERLNGWAENEDYWIETKYKVKANKNYYDIVFDCVENTAKQYTNDNLGMISMGLSAMMKGFTGTKSIDELNEYLKTNPEPKKMSQLKQVYKPEVLTISLQDCANHFTEKSNIFHKDLKMNDFFEYSIKLRFKKTENGWKNI